MKKKITKNTIKRGLRTFFQAFFGAFVTAGAGIIWTDIDIKNALIGILLTSLFAGFSAIGMNLEIKEN